ncbi:(2Fe-2S)-binding protein [Paenibacillus sp. FSL R7-0331]|uniref:(2Fe-2S)-binding protein n=1 Tax=Paenibacillus sp. FSL R7-0331 TaxID=1536773 RepID=UPI0005AADA9B|nr:(2Fe-2S)-binding protein [Paenibacillus sp. FSL R7-0331]
MTEEQEQEQIKDFGSKFDLHPGIPEGTKHSFNAGDMADEAGMRAFIECYRPLIKGLDDKVAATYFAGAFGNIALAVQYALTVASAVPVVSLQRLSVHLIPADGYWRAAFSLGEWSFEPAPAEAGQRREWRNEQLIRFYRDTAAPMLSMLSRVTGLSGGEIWGQLPTKFNYYLEVFTSGGLPERLLNTLQDDYRYLCEEIPAEIFGLKKNPFRVQVRKLESLADPDKTVNMRNRCCLYYRTEGGSYCYTCPRLKEEERAVRRTEFRKPASAGQA